MNRIVKSDAMRHRMVTALLTILCLATACGSRTQAADFLSVQALKEDLALRDTTVWKNELLARQHEKLFVQLADDLRRAEDKIIVLARLPFDSISIPRPQGKPVVLDLDIQLQAFDPNQAVAFSHPDWERALQPFQTAGWRIVQTEWHHEQFTPPAPDKSARSVVAFEIHGEQPARANRFILSGALDVVWKSELANPAPVGPQSMAITRLQLLERSGPTPFDNHAVIAPEPALPGGQVNLHPLLVQDINGDQADDILLPGVNKVLVNDGQAAFAPLALIEDRLYEGWKEVGVVGDFDGDAVADLLGVPASGSLSNVLTLYSGDGKLPFRRGPRPAWPGQRLMAPSVLTAGDIDGDGDLDVWLGQYKPPYVNGQLPTPYYDANDGYPSYLLINDGKGNFDQATARAGLHLKRFRRVLAGSLADLDLDGDMDLVTLNDFCGVELFYNNGAGVFTDETRRLDNRHLFGMGHCLADFDRDGRQDLLAIGMSIATVRRLEFMKLQPLGLDERTSRRVDMAYGNRLYLHRDGQWIQPPFAAQLARTGWSWGVSAFDLDNDSDLEIYVANGHVSGASGEDYCSTYWTRDIYLGSSREDSGLQRYFDEALLGLNSGKTSWNGYQHNVLFLDRGGNDYVDTAFLMGVAHETDGRAVVSADLSADGCQDLLVTEAQWMGSPNRMRHRLLIHLNRSPAAKTNHWLGVRLSSAKPGLSPIGTKVRVRTAAATYVRQVVTGDSFQSQHPCTVHFGLGRSDSVRELEILWPNGQSQSIANPAIDRYHQAQPPD